MTVIIILLVEIFFSSALADGFYWSLSDSKSTSNNQDSPKDSCRSQQWCSLCSLHPSRYFKVLQSLYETFADCTKSTNYNRYYCHFHVPQFFKSLATLSILPCVPLQHQSLQFFSLSLFCWFYNVWSSSRD